MKVPSIRVGVIAGLVALSVPAVLAQQEGHEQGMPGMQMTTMEMECPGPLAALHGEEFDVAFISMMVAHHQAAIEMSEWLLERTDDPKLEEAAEAVITAQGPEIEQMEAWLEDWYGREIEEMMAGMMRSDMVHMMSRMEARKDADRAFLEMMTEHHMSALDMAQLALVRSERPELRTLARDIIVAQAEEIHQYQEWLAVDRVQ